ncbi:hypothetical protein RVBP21_1330 [Pseudomonas phage BRkr]|nr:hypothetical protein RVBP21_1330 [Pseudomonas phage BRkr]
MELTIPLSLDNNFEHVIFKYGDLTDCISILDRKGRIDNTYSITVEMDDLFDNEWLVTIQSKPNCRRFLKFKRYWFRYNSATGRFAGDPFFIAGLRKRFIHIKTPSGISLP